MTLRTYACSCFRKSFSHWFVPSLSELQNVLFLFLAGLIFSRFLISYLFSCFIQGCSLNNVTAWMVSMATAVLLVFVYLSFFYFPKHASHGKSPKRSASLLSDQQQTTVRSYKIFYFVTGKQSRNVFHSLFLCLCLSLSSHIPPYYVSFFHCFLFCEQDSSAMEEHLLNSNEEASYAAP